MPSTGLIGPSTDIARFMRAYLNHGSLDGNLLLQPESVSISVMKSEPAGSNIPKIQTGWRRSVAQKFQIIATMNPCMHEYCGDPTNWLSIRHVHKHSKTGWIQHRYM
jgi:hypothetical protein